MLCNDNTADDPFSLNGTDMCGTGFSSFDSGIGTIANAVVAPLIADGFLALSVQGNGSVNNFAFISSAATHSGVLFPVTNNFSAALGGTITLTPVPEPSTLLLLGTGLGMVGVRYRRRQKQ